ncbi:MAG: hypothetical protein KatS3mg106_397 [Gemmataceae bacterium]|nr:MAG: hypothetical protein KatS3mg106_397 [Gemmataceae bacterium]
MRNRRYLCLFIAGLMAGLSGCGGSASNERKNDPGPSIQLNPKGPPPMQPGGSSMPPQLKDKK